MLPLQPQCLNPNPKNYPRVLRQAQYRLKCCSKQNLSIQCGDSFSQQVTSIVEFMSECDGGDGALYEQSVATLGNIMARMGRQLVEVRLGQRFLWNLCGHLGKSVQYIQGNYKSQVQAARRGKQLYGDLFLLLLLLQKSQLEKQFKSIISPLATTAIVIHFVSLPFNRLPVDTIRVCCAILAYLIHGFYQEMEDMEVTRALVGLVGVCQEQSAVRYLLHALTSQTLWRCLSMEQIRNGNIFYFIVNNSHENCHKTFQSLSTAFIHMLTHHPQLVTDIISDLQAPKTKPSIIRILTHTIQKMPIKFCLQLLQLGLLKHFRSQNELKQNKQMMGPLMDIIRMRLGQLDGNFVHVFDSLCRMGVHPGFNGFY